ncbi:acid-sensing ion channel 1C-like [Amphiura filiformis]|uniref:acid-sensing ion channel 1C-like n=1 Tax=Amphiura filiformis TaxID=82378 RepID=UPI003B21F3EE
MSRLWRQLGTPGVISPRPNRQSNTSQLGAPYYVPNANANGGRGSTQRINVTRPDPFGGFARDPYGYTTHDPSSRAESPAHSNHGFWMASPNHNDEPILPAAASNEVKTSSGESYMTYDDNMFIFKYSSDSDTAYPEKSRSKTKSSDSKASGSQQEADENIFQEFFQETGFDGLKHAGNNSLSYLMRFFWTVIVCLALAGLLYQVINSIKKYSTFPSNTKYGIEDIKYLDFPAVTLCNVNLFRYDKLINSYGGYDRLVDPGLGQLRQLFPQMGIGNNIDEAKKPELSDHYPGDMDLHSFILEHSHRLDEMLAACTFNDEPCNAGNFTPILTNYGYAIPTIAVEMVDPRWTSIKQGSGEV